jgi:hypothetical protein
VARALATSIPPARPAAAVQDLDFFVALEKSNTLSNLERWQVVAAIIALNRGETPPPFLSKKERDDLAAPLYQKLESKSTSGNEKWRIVEYLEILESGGNPGAFVSESFIVGQLDALNASLEAASDPAEINRIFGQFDAVSKGAPFVTRAEHEKKLADLEARLEASKSNHERYALAAEINALR